MAKIKVFGTTIETKKNAKKADQRIKGIKMDVDEYILLLNETKAKLVEKANKLAEEKKEEELATQRKKEEERLRKLEEEKKKEEIAKEQKQDLKAKEIKEITTEAELKISNEKISMPEKPKEKKQQSDKSATKKRSDTKPKEINKYSGNKEINKDSKPHRQDVKANTIKRDDVVDQFLSQPSLTDNKEKSDNPKAHNKFDNKGKNKRSKKDYWNEVDSTDEKLGVSRKNRKAKKSTYKTPAPQPERKKAITMGDIITVKELSEKIGITVSQIIKKLMDLGILATINNEIDYDTASLVALEFNVELEKRAIKTYEEVLEEEDEKDDPESLIQRPPVVTVMGHVDHGKTSLLDAIKDSDVTKQEAGGITQHIGAYTVNIDGKLITFLDTPGHEAFTSMRARGAQVTDIAILVVAADDGVMPQTVEAINHAKAAKVPIIVAINKIDRPNANQDKVKQELAEQGLVVEDWGGDTIAVPISALKREGIDDLLGMIILVAEMEDIKANPNRLAKGIIIEAELDKGRGPVATVLVQNGTLHVGDSVVTGVTYGRVRAMLNDKGKRIDEAGPSMPVEVLGLSEVPEAGDILYAVEDDKLAKQVSDERKEKAKELQTKSTSATTLDDLFSQLKEGEVKDLNIIVKADVQGSVEAIKQALEKLSNDQVRINFVHGGVGAITETDVMLASASSAIIIGFNVRPSTNASDLAEKEGIDIRTYRVIYSVIGDIEAAMKGMLDPEFKEVVIGHASVRNTFKISNIGTIAGAYVTDGKISRNAEMRLLRDGVIIHEGKISSLKRFKDDAREVTTNYECGIGLEDYNDIKDGDVIEAFVMEEIKR